VGILKPAARPCQTYINRYRGNWIVNKGNLDQVADAIRSMEIRGAALIARSAAEALRDLAEAYEGTDIEAFRSALMAGKEKLLDSRPTAVSLWNAVQSVTCGMQEVKEVGSLRSLVIKNAEAFTQRSKEATKRIGRIGARQIMEGATVLTHCNSSVVMDVIRTAFSQGKNVRVIATESRPWRQGLITVRELASDGIPVTLIVDSAVRWVMREVDLVLVGADTIASDGSVVNKIGTSQIALIAQEARVPFIVCAETYKFSPLTLTGEPVEIEERRPEEVVLDSEIPKGVKVLNPVFDITPPEYVDSIITEVGVIPPFAAYEVIVKQLGQEFLFENIENRSGE